MTAAFECDKVLLVQAELDGELDAAEAAALTAHRAECQVCQAAAAELARARGLLATAGRSELYHAMPDEVRARLSVNGKLVQELTVRSGVFTLAGADPVESEGRRATVLRKMARDAAREVLRQLEGRGQDGKTPARGKPRS